MVSIVSILERFHGTQFIKLGAHIFRAYFRGVTLRNLGCCKNLSTLFMGYLGPPKKVKHLMVTEWQLPYYRYLFFQGMVEKWLIQVEEVMLLSLQKVAKEALKAYAETEREKWVQEWPGQVKIVLALLFILFRNGSLVKKLLDT